MAMTTNNSTSVNPRDWFDFRMSRSSIKKEPSPNKIQPLRIVRAKQGDPARRGKDCFGRIGLTTTGASETAKPLTSETCRKRAIASSDSTLLVYHLLAKCSIDSAKNACGHIFWHRQILAVFRVVQQVCHILLPSRHVPASLQLIPFPIIRRVPRGRKSACFPLFFAANDFFPKVNAADSRFFRGSAAGERPFSRELRGFFRRIVPGDLPTFRTIEGTAVRTGMSPFGRPASGAAKGEGLRLACPSLLAQPLARFQQENRDAARI